MNDLSKKKQNFENTGERPIYNINSFRGLNMDRNKQANEVKINNNNLTSRIIFEINNNTKEHDKSRTISKNKMIATKLQSATIDKNKINKSILEISYNQKSSPKKLFAETSKKNTFVNNNYANEIINTNSNAYITCLTDENEVRMPKFDEKLDKNISKFINSEKNNNRIQQPGTYLVNGNTENCIDKSRLNFNYKKQNIQFRPITLQSKSSISNRQEIINSPYNSEKGQTNKNYLNTNVSEKLDNSILQNSVNISRTHESFLPKLKNNQEIEDGKVLPTEYSTNPTSFNFKTSRQVEKGRTSKVRLEDGISINIVKTHGDKRIKKFFHIPDFEIYVVKEIPLNNKTQNLNISSRIKEWNKKMSNSDKFVKVYKEYINSPEGYISLVLEYMEGYSLADMMENFGSLNENLLQKIGGALLSCLAEFEDSFLEDFGEICPCHILFDKYGNLKLSPKHLNPCKKEIDPLNPENKEDNFFNKCICYEFFHNSIRNKIRYILRELTKDMAITPSVNGENNFPDRNTKEFESKLQNNESNYKNSNSSMKKGISGCYLYTQDEENHANVTNHTKNKKQFEKPLNSELKPQKSRVKDSLMSSRKDRVIQLYSENSERKDGVWHRSNSHKSTKCINKSNLNDYFISEKNLRSKLNFEKLNPVKETENNLAEKNLNDNSKGFSSETNLFNKRNSFNKSNNLRDTGKFSSNNSNNVDLNKFNSNGSNSNTDLNKFNSTGSNSEQNKPTNTPLTPLGNKSQVITNSDKINLFENEENLNLNHLKNIIGGNNYQQISYFSEIKNGGNANINNNINANIKIGNNNISNNPNISIFNNFIFSFNKNEKISSLIKNKSQNQNGNKNQTNLDRNSNMNKNFITNLEKNNEFKSKCSTEIFDNQENYFSQENIKTEGDTTRYINYSAKRLETQANYETCINTNTNLNNLATNGASSIDKLKSHKNNKVKTNYNFPKHYFSIGYIFIIMACKSIKLKIFDYLENFTLTNLEEIKQFKLKKCCLFHFLISLEEALKINKKYSLENFFKGFSEDFKNFICNLTTISLSNRAKTKKKCLQGNPIYNLNSRCLMEHPWIKSEKNFMRKFSDNYSHVKISLREIIKIVRESFKTSLIEYNEKKYENILNKLEIILNNHRNELQKENVKLILMNQKNIIKKISLDIGVNYQEFFEKVYNLVNDVFSKN